MQGCSRKLHTLLHGLTGNISGHFTPVVALKYYATRKISARIICRASGKEITKKAYTIKNVQLTVYRKSL